MATLYRSSNFGHLTGKDEVEVMNGTREECEAKAAELEAKGFKTRIHSVVINEAAWSAQCERNS